MNRKALVWGGAVAIAAGVAYLACGGGTSITPPPCLSCLPDSGHGAGFDAGLDAGRDAGTGAGLDAGQDAGTGAGADGGMDAGPPVPPWPDVPVMNYSDTFHIGYAQSVGIDDAYNLWLLNGDQIGVLRPGDAKPTWTSGVGQAGNSYLANGSTVICGGSEGHAYVGYSTSDGPNYHTSPSDPEYQQGDMDLVEVGEGGVVSLTTHLGKTDDGITSGLYTHLGIRNSNSWMYDEDRSVWSCFKATSGPRKGDVFIGTNHGVVMIQGDKYNSHIHPFWTNANGTQMFGYTYGVSVAPDGDVLIANAWMVAVAQIDGVLAHFSRMPDYTQFRIAEWLPDVAVPPDFGNYRAIAQTLDGRYWVGGDHGLWEPLWRARPGDPLRIDSFGDRRVNEIGSSVSSLAATDDGSLFIGTNGAGLYRRLPDDTYERISEVKASTVGQLVYDDSGSPSMLLVLTNDGLYVLRGH